MESMDGDPASIYKPVYKSFKFKSTQLKKELKVEKNTSLKDEDNVLISNLKSKDNELVLNPHPDDIPNSIFYTAWKDCMESNERKKISTRRAAGDYDSPELVGFLQESSTYQFFKDICIDKEVTCQDNMCPVENCELDHNTISCILDSDPDSDSESIGESLDSGSSTSTEDQSNECGNSKNLEIQDEIFFTARDHLSTKRTISETLSVVVQAPSEAMDDNRCASNASSVKSDRENSFINRRHEAAQSVELHPSEIGNIFASAWSEYGISDSAKESSQRHQHCDAESSSSASEPTSGPLGFSVALPGFGSTSLRSNSSTTSSRRSFAFPILSSEWNGSPARMVAADERQLRRHRHSGWGIRFLCCKF